jgi:hypothetical protein
MTEPTVRVHGTFELQNPPDGGTEWFKSVLAKCDYPFWRVLPFVRADNQQIIQVVWVDEGGILGSWSGTGILRIGLQALTYRRADQEFTLIHEMGHMVDTAVMQRYGHHPTMLALLHEVDQGWYECSDPTDWNLPHATVPHYARHTEAFADLFVYAFAPSLWPGQRMTHHHPDPAYVRSKILEARVTVPFTDISTQSQEVKDAIEWGYATGVMGGTTATTFGPNDPLTRRQLVVALHRNYKLDIAEGGT